MRSIPQINRSFLQVDASTVEQNANKSIHDITSDSPSSTPFRIIISADPNVFMVIAEDSPPIQSETPILHKIDKKD